MVSQPITTPWTASPRDGEFVGLVGDTSFEWDRTGRGGIAERDARTGRLVRTRPIAGLHVNGDPRYWERIPGGFVTHWDGPAVVREGADGELAVAWAAPSSDWFDSHVVVGGSLVTAGARNASAIVRMSLADGREEWRTPLVAWSQSIELDADDRRVYANYTEYVPTAPTPTIAIPLRVQAFELATGARAWSVDFTTRPNAAAARHDTVVVAVDNELRFLDGPSGAVRRAVAIGRPNTNVYPAIAFAGRTVFAALEYGVFAFDLDGNRLWHEPLDLSSTPRLAFLPGIVLVATPGASVAALDASNGTILWDVGLGVGGYRLFANPSAVVLAGGHSGAGFGLPVNLPVERATFHGRVVRVDCGTFADVRIRIGSATVPVAPDGTYRATIEARHAVLVEGPGAFALLRSGAPPEAKAARVIRLTGAGEYEVGDLTLSVCST